MYTEDTRCVYCLEENSENKCFNCRDRLCSEHLFICRNCNTIYCLECFEELIGCRVCNRVLLTPRRRLQGVKHNKAKSK